MDSDFFPRHFLHNFDSELQEFYHRVVHEETKLDIVWRAKAVQQDITEIVKAYRKTTVSKGNSSICFDTPSKRCAYVLKHSTCFTSAVANYMLKFINYGDNRDILLKILEKGQLNICCLGGGPGTDAVAIIKLIQGLYHTIWRDTLKKLAIHVTVVDLNEDWHKTAINVFNCLEKTASFFDGNELTLYYNFISADLTQPTSDKVKKVINSADMVTLIYFLSAVNGSKMQTKSLSMMQNIMQEMKEGAFLFFLDSAADHHYKILNKAAEKWPSMVEVYGPLVEELHTISLESVSKFLDLHAKHFDTFFSMSYNFLSVSSWYKMKTEQPRFTLNKDCSTESSWRTPSHEESDKLTKKMLQYRTTVNKLVAAKYCEMKAYSAHRLYKRNYFHRI